MKFVCGLMPDPRPFVDHVYTTFIEHVLEEIRKNCTVFPYIDTSLLESLYQESAVPLSGSVLHNQHINYYNHGMDDKRKKPRDVTPVFSPSKLYVFKWMKEDVTLDHKTSKMIVTRCTSSGQSEPNSFNNQECAIWIYQPDNSLTKRLLSFFRTISSYQPVTDLYLEYNRYGDRCELTEEHVPIMSKETKSMVLKHVSVSSSVWNYLLQHESLEVLRLDRTHLHDGAVPLIFNHKNLKTLSLNTVYIHHEMCQHVCHHLQDLVYLGDIDLSNNDLSQVPSIRLSNTRSPVSLKLCSTHMSPEMLKSFGQLTSAVNLNDLDLSFNTLTGCLHHLLSEPHQGLLSLDKLNLRLTKLNNHDIKSLTHAVQRHVLHGLKVLNLESNSLDEMQRETEELIRTCVTHHQRELKLELWFNNLSEEIQEKWKLLCQGTDIKLSFSFFEGKLTKKLDLLH